MVTISRDSGAGAYSQSAPAAVGWPLSPAATGEAVLPAMCPLASTRSAPSTYLGRRNNALLRPGCHLAGAVQCSGAADEYRGGSTFGCWQSQANREAFFLTLAVSRDDIDERGSVHVCKGLWPAVALGGRGDS